MNVCKYDSAEFSWKGTDTGNPFMQSTVEAVFSRKNRNLYVDGFYDGGGVYKVRFMPDEEGEWEYSIRSNLPELDGQSGSFTCLPPKLGVHGPVRVHNSYHFRYDDGTPYRQVGTTCYVWNHQSQGLRRKTLETLRNAPFNKMRMCVFPKHYDFNTNEPEVFPFEKGQSGFDFTRFDPKGWALLEECIRQLTELDIQTDIILFHPYDRWGFSTMGAEADDRYLKYAVARLAAYRNVWWSFANEFDFMTGRSEEDWDRYFRIVQSCDPYQHLRGIHNGFRMYDHGKPWVTHCSIQSSEMGKIPEWHARYGKPIIIDECLYEGNIHLDWGNNSAEEMTSRFWDGFVRGAYVGHGETYLNDREELWWSKGGELVGQSPARIAFFRRFLEDAPEGFAPMLQREWRETPIMGVEGQYYLHYTGARQPAVRFFRLPEGVQFTVDIIDTWNMTVERLPGTVSGETEIRLPTRKYMAVLMKRA